MSSKEYRVEDGKKFKLSKFDPDDAGAFASREECEAETTRLTEKLIGLQERFYVDGRYAMLIVFQAMDTGGKDGAIRKCFRGLDPTGCEVTSFKKPTSEELRHDFLWRIHRAAPPKGKFGIFNRSHYEDVLIARVHDLVPKSLWRQRYGHIRDFEECLAEHGTTVLKFFLYISKDEQKKRLQARLDDPTKHWKFQVGDIDERKHWDEYIDAYEEAIQRCSMPDAPWYVVPANKKWYRNYVILDALVRALGKLELEYPKAEFDPTSIRID